MVCQKLVNLMTVKKVIEKAANNLRQETELRMQKLRIGIRVQVAKEAFKRQLQRHGGVDKAVHMTL